MQQSPLARHELGMLWFMADALSQPPDKLDTRQFSALCFFVIICSWEGWKPLLVSRFMGDSECQTQACVLINGTAPVLAAHSTDWSKTCKRIDTGFHITVKLFIHHL